MAKVTRNAHGVRRSAAARSRADAAQSARDKTGHAYVAAVSFLPFSQEELQRIFLALIFSVALLLAWMVASFAGLPAYAQQQFAQAASNAGFEVRRIQVTGAKRVNELQVYEKVLVHRSTPMPAVDLDAIRAELLTIGWIKDARVSRQLPDTIIVDIVERTPFAALQRGDKFMLIDDQGVTLEDVKAANIGAMLIISGDQARGQIADLIAVLDAAPALRPQIKAAQWIGNRRWNMRLVTDQIIALPQGREKAAAAMISFASLDGRNRLIGGKVAHFDMRVPGKLHMRVPGRSAMQAESALATAGAAQ